MIETKEDLTGYTLRYACSDSITWEEARQCFQLEPEPERLLSPGEYIARAQETGRLDHVFFYLHHSEGYINRKIGAYAPGAARDDAQPADFMELKLAWRDAVLAHFADYDPLLGVGFNTFIDRFARDAMLSVMMQREAWSLDSLSSYKTIRRAAAIFGKAGSCEDALKACMQQFGCSEKTARKLLQNAEGFRKRVITVSGEPDDEEDDGSAHAGADRDEQSGWQVSGGGNVRRGWSLSVPGDSYGGETDSVGKTAMQWSEGAVEFSSHVLPLTENEIFTDHYSYAGTLWNGADAVSIDRAFDKLSFRDQDLLEKRNAICMNCGRVSPLSKRMTFEELARRYELSGTAGAEKAYAKAVERLMLELCRSGALYCVRIKQLSVRREGKNETGAVYAYQVNNAGNWGEIVFDFVNDTEEVTVFAENDPADTWKVTDAAIEFVKGAGKLPKKGMVAVYWRG